MEDQTKETVGGITLPDHQYSATDCYVNYFTTTKNLNNPKLSPETEEIQRKKTIDDASNVLYDDVETYLDEKTMKDLLQFDENQPSSSDNDNICFLLENDNLFDFSHPIDDETWKDSFAELSSFLYC